MTHSNVYKDELTCRERLERTFEGREVDRIATYDIIHNVELIEYATGQKVTPVNAEDLLCRTINRYLDLVRHFAVPDYEGVKIIDEGDGFVYRYEWWTGQILQKPAFKTVEDVVRLVEKDIEKISACTEKGKICQAANNHVNLFYEKFEYFEEVCREYRRISEKLGGTVMLGPEMPMGVSIALFRYGIDWWTYLYHDCPEIALKYIQVYSDYETAFINSYAGMYDMPFVCSAGSTGLNDRLLFAYDFFKEVILPAEKKVIDAFKRNGKKYIIHFLDGYKWPIINDFVDMGTDAVDPFEPYCLMDIKKFRQQFPETVVCQPVDCTQLLPYGTEEQVKEATLNAIKDAGGYKILIGSTSEIHPEVNYRNAVAMYESARSFTL
ncbi:MAG: hypothetical protein FJW66_08825 [Actinobacteria bacterium]|nr:hypothetical protein [Actinomycetota bacterium]